MFEPCRTCFCEMRCLHNLSHEAHHIGLFFHHDVAGLLQFGPSRSSMFPRFKHRPGQKFGSRFLLNVHPCKTSGTTRSGTRVNPKTGNSSKKKVKAQPTGCRYVDCKEETRMKSNGRVKSEWKNIEIWKAKGKRRWTPTRAVTQDLRASPNSQETHPVRK